MQAVSNVTIEFFKNVIKLGEWNFLLLKSGDVKIWNSKEGEEKCTYQYSLESAIFYTKNKW